MLSLFWLSPKQIAEALMHQNPAAIIVMLPTLPSRLRDGRAGFLLFLALAFRLAAIACARIAGFLGTIQDVVHPFAAALANDTVQNIVGCFSHYSTLPHPIASKHAAPTIASPATIDRQPGT